MTDELDQLAMAGRWSRVRVGAAGRAAGRRLMPSQIDGGWVSAGPDGVDQVEIVMVAHPGAPELPIAKGASGGELSRVMLALEVVLADADPVATMVFDEVDAGVGGRAATEIGSRLAALARSHQVIVVTHLAQVAAYADRHFVVDASTSGRVGTSDVRVVDRASTGRPSWPGCSAAPTAPPPARMPGTCWAARGRRRPARAPRSRQRAASA